MSLILLVLVLAVVAGYLAGGRLGALAHLRLPRIWLVWLAFSVQFVVAFLPPDPRQSLRAPLVGLAFALVAVWIVGVWPGLTRVLQGALVLIAVGWAMNLAVITMNNGMPVSAETLERVGLPSEDIESGDLGKHVALDEDTVLPWLGDVIPLPLVGTLRKAISVGDVVMLLGLALFIPAGMRLRDDEAEVPAADPDAT